MDNNGSILIYPERNLYNSRTNQFISVWKLPKVPNFTYKLKRRLLDSLRSQQLPQTPKMLRANFCDIANLQVNRFTKCGICTVIKEHIHKLKGKTRRITWVERKTMHLQQQAWVSTPTYIKSFCFQFLYINFCLFFLLIFLRLIRKMSDVFLRENNDHLVYILL